MTIDVLRNSQLCCGLSAKQMAEVTEAVCRVSYVSGDVIFHQDTPGDSMFIVAQGRVKIEVAHRKGDECFVDYLHVGEHFGEMAMLTGGRRAVTMTAVMDCELLELRQDAFQRLLTDIPGLAANVCRTLGFRLRRETTGHRSRTKPRVIGLVNNSPRTTTPTTNRSSARLRWRHDSSSDRVRAAYRCGELKEVCR